ncbi:OmpA family protein [Urechidicola croceus]|uniref:OmpA-like domain-containing protein n=1 Tax=Urechidicola croceus TaxID=1850246 RepID=A0A1D8P5S9_9FLAO|nr:OmpA family protein [Urechidicola croceus]AOW19938.1 hypothetical protein LPB138_04230 [Urechidicola croceus]
MKNFLLAFLLFLLWAFFALWFHNTVSHKNCDSCKIGFLFNCDSISKTGEEVEKAKKNVTTENVKTAFSITDIDGNSIFNFPNKFIINSKDGTVNIPDAITGFKDSIYYYLNKNQTKELLLRAKYLSTEVMGSNNWGMSRTEFLKNILIKYGINGDKIITEAIESDYKYDVNGTNSDAITILFRDISEERVANIEAGITNKTLYSNFGEAEFKPDRTLQGYTIELKNYLQKYTGKTVTITGHTDNIGDATGNQKLGLQRANQVKTYLASQGIASEILSATSKGETAPVATNDTDEGRSLNRRIEIIVN